jgi:portal protein
MNKLAIAGRELMKGNIGNAIVAIATKSVSSELIQPSRWRNGNFFFGVNGADKAFIWGNFNSSLIAYQFCPIVSAVINKKAQALVNGQTVIKTDDGKKIAKTDYAKGLLQLMKRPNALQTGKQFKAQGNIYKGIYGYCPVLIVKPVGFEGDPSRWKLWNIPPWMLQIRDKTDLFYTTGDAPFQSIWLTYMGHSVQLDPSSIFFLRENQISTGTYMMNNSSENNVSLFLPDSKLFSLEKPIDTFIASLDSRGSLIRNRGPQWLLTNDSNDNPEAGIFPNDPDQLSNLHKDFLQYGIRSGQRKAIITDAKLKLQTVGFDVKQLQLLEGELQDAKQICDGLNYPPYLLGLVDAKFDNQDIAERSLYTNSIIPDSDSDDEQWSYRLGADQMGLKIVTDFSHLPALQEDITEQGRGRWYMDQALLIEFESDLITQNQWREALGMDTVAGRDLYYSELVAQGIIKPKPSVAAPANVSSDTAASNSNNQNSNNGNGN